MIELRIDNFFFTASSTYVSSGFTDTITRESKCNPVLIDVFGGLTTSAASQGARGIVDRDSGTQVGVIGAVNQVGSPGFQTNFGNIHIYDLPSANLATVYLIKIKSNGTDNERQRR